MSWAASLPGAELFFQKTDFQEFWDSCAQSKTSKISKHGLSGILGLLCAEHDVGHVKALTFRNSGTPVRRIKRRKSQQMNFQEFWDSCVQSKTLGISENGLSGFLRLLCARQNVVHLKECTFRISGSPVRRTERRKSRKHALSGIQVTKTNSVAWGRTFLGGMPPLGTTF